MKKLIYCAMSVCIVSVAQAQTCNPNTVRTAPDSRYELILGSGGSEVLDKQTGLIWQRCSLGQTWDGTTCTGTASDFTWADALAKSKAVGNDYRLPNIKELSSLTEKACAEPAINVKFFPNTPSSAYWSASVQTRTYEDRYASLVHFQTGESSNGDKTGSVNKVRVVRAGQ